jgi:histidinol-phosphate/aromatic aminotransferase/cobyric acid decarboxylase-like protein
MITWEKNLEYLYNLYHQEKDEYESYLKKEGYIIGTYIEDIEEVVQKYQKSRGIVHEKGTRLFGDSYRDLLLKEIIENHYQEILKNSELQKQTVSLLKIMKTYPETCNFFLLKLKEIENSENINTSRKMIA